MPRPRLKRLLRIGLRDLLVVVTVLCVLLGWKVREVKRQKEAVAWVKDVGGRVTYDYYEGYMSFEYDEHGTLILHRELPGPDWLCELIGVDFFASVVEVSLGTDRVNDLSPLKELKKLKKLILFPFQVADEDIAALQKALPDCEVWTLLID